MLPQFELANAAFSHLRKTIPLAQVALLDAAVAFGGVAPTGRAGCAPSL